MSRPWRSGINLAIQDAVAAANILAAKLADGSLSDHDLGAVQRRREFQPAHTEASDLDTNAVISAFYPVAMRLPFLGR